MKSLSFSRVTFADLQKLVQIEQISRQDLFDEWFGFAYALRDEERDALQKLIERNWRYVLSYSEDELKIKFVGPLLNLVDFQRDGVRDWYQRPLQTIIHDVTLHGYVDFMVARGVKEPDRPYFFIQEFKKTKFEVDPEDQLLAEMLAALTLNQVEVMRGAYIIGQEWRFVILRKIAPDAYEYAVSLIFDCLNIDHLERIYTNLQAVKYQYCIAE